ncbi:hypothetical protein DBIPINDM_006875 [Mesorhizobium sp. AR02]|uniref:hypothetical protein n=1 Tax=Mesorhizobium sp. AR02 TaxID=2865837 RepID=UPI00215F08AA|nr:hypothetical protein [Mesorhizobium sp. AR02]UVK53389.1 hypothetical protein DBIPINDM_006875 [Mesorhizobium sp. AR02]
MHRRIDRSARGDGLKALGGVTGKLWEIADIVALSEAKETEKPVARGPYKKKTA